MAVEQEYRNYNTTFRQYYNSPYQGVEERMDIKEKIMAMELDLEKN